MALQDALKRIAEKRGASYGEFRKRNRTQKSPREKFIEAIEKNIKLLDNGKLEGDEKKESSRPINWCETLDDGSIAIRPRYGIAFLVQDQAIYASNKNEAKNILKDLREAADAGEFDAELKKISNAASEKLRAAKENRPNKQMAA